MAEIAEIHDVGLVFGKFYPLTRGHQYLIETARSGCHKLFVGISGRSSETIPQHVRADWLRRIYPDVTVIAQPQSLPYYPEECSSPEVFYNTWTEALQQVCGGRSPDVLFTSEDYGQTMAGYLKCQHVLVDKDRTRVPISATRVRANPFACWNFLHPIVRSHFVKVVCVNGPESTGKTTLCEKLGRHFDTIWQPEWARGYLGDRHCEYDDMEIIAREHFREHQIYREKANKVLFMDTDAITTAIYSQHYYQKTPSLVCELANRVPQYVDLQLLCDIDAPWVPETSRDLGQPWQRELMKQKFLAELSTRQLQYVTINGSWDQRLATAIKAVDHLIFKRGDVTRQQESQ